jgi:GR25 family glycosyltransferase involved in LPS biosynthesis
MKRRSIHKLLKKNTFYCDLRGGCYNNFDTNLGVYVINCKTHKKRYEKLLKSASKAKVKTCRSPCIEGRELSSKRIVDFVNDDIVKKHSGMTKVEVAINISHFNAWKKLINSCYDLALILEDDVVLHDDFLEKINLILNTLNKNNITFSILHLWNGNWNKTIHGHKKIITISEKLSITQETLSYNAGAAAYIISKKYAVWLMDHFFPIKMPQDMLMGNFPKVGRHLTLKMKWNKKQKCYNSPILNLKCDGEGGTGKDTTQTYDAPVIKDIYNEYLKKNITKS